MFASTPARPSDTTWATIADAAAILGVHRDTVRRMIDRGEIYAERVGPRLVRIDLSSVSRTPLGPATRETAVPGFSDAASVANEGGRE